MLDINTAIKHCLEVAEEQSRLYSLCPCPCDGTKNCMSLKNGKDMGCTKCAADHRQIAEWLTDYKELREKIKKLEKELEVAKLINHAEFKTLCKYNHVGGSENG